MKSAPHLGSHLETLEDRSLPSTFGVPWADAEHLTISFADDGTQTPLGASSLSKLLSSAGTSAQWKFEILRAFQTWAANTNINLGLVSDGGQALGSVGAVQGDSRFGDIRLAAANLSSDVIASASPFSWIGTTLAGDVILNASNKFSLNGGMDYNLFAVALHEAGHALGLAHAGEEGGPEEEFIRSVMEALYAQNTGLSPEDVSAIQSLYGTRRADAYDAAGGNDTAAKASAIPRNTASQLLASGDLTTMSDVDYYKFTAPALTSMLSSVTVRLKTEGLSLLTANVTVYDSAGRIVASSSSTDPLNNDLILSFRPSLFGGNYTIKVEGARNDVFDIGAYKLSVDFLSLGGLLSPITTTLTGVLDGHTDDVLSSALGLKAPATSDARFDAIYRGVIEDTRDVDSYKIRTDKFAPGTLVTLNVMVWGLDSNPLDGRVRVYDANGKAVAFQVLSNDRGLFSVQVLNAVAGKDYFVQVSAREGAVKNTGSYFFAADFNKISPLVFDNVAGGTLQAGQATATETLKISEAGVFQFALGASSSAPSDDVTMTVSDASGNVLFTLTATAGLPPVTATKYMLAGTYTVKYSAAKANLSSTNYALFLAQISDGIDPYTTSTASPSSTTSPDSTSPASDPYAPPSSTSPPSDPYAPPPPDSTSSTSTSDPYAPPSSTTTTSSPPPPSGSSTPPASDPYSGPMMPPPPPSYSYYGYPTYQPYGYYYTY